MATLPIAIFKFSAIPIKILTHLFPDIENITLNFILKPPHELLNVSPLSISNYVDNKGLGFKKEIFHLDKVIIFTHGVQLHF